MRQSSPTTRVLTDIRCGSCESSDTSVALTRKTNRSITRHRKCRTCGHIFQTIEINARHFPTGPTLDFPFRKASS